MSSRVTSAQAIVSVTSVVVRHVYFCWSLVPWYLAKCEVKIYHMLITLNCNKSPSLGSFITYQLSTIYKIYPLYCNIFQLT